MAIQELGMLSYFISPSTEFEKKLLDGLKNARDELQNTAKELARFEKEVESLIMRKGL